MPGRTQISCLVDCSLPRCICICINLTCRATDQSSTSRCSNRQGKPWAVRPQPRSCSRPGCAASQRCACSQHAWVVDQGPPSLPPSRPLPVVLLACRMCKAGQPSLIVAAPLTPLVADGSRSTDMGAGPAASGRLCRVAVQMTVLCLPLLRWTTPQAYDQGSLGL